MWCDEQVLPDVHGSGFLWPSFGSAGHFRHENCIFKGTLYNRANQCSRNIEATKKEEIFLYWASAKWQAPWGDLCNFLFGFSLIRGLFLLSFLCLGHLGKMLSWFIDKKPHLWPHCLTFGLNRAHVVGRGQEICWRTRSFPCWCNIPPNWSRFLGSLDKTHSRVPGKMCGMGCSVLN